MKNSMKKFFIISTSLLVVVLVFLGIYYFSFRGDTADTGGNVLEIKKDNEGAGLLDIGGTEEEKKIFPVGSQSVTAPVLNKEGDKVIYHSLADGSLFEFSIENRREKNLEKKDIQGLMETNWSSNKKREIVKIKNGESVLFRLYDFESGKSADIKSGVDNIAWVDLGNKIVYKYFNGETKERSLNIADPDGSNWKKIRDIDFRKISIAPIPETSLISIWNYPNALEETSLKSISTINGEAKDIFSGKFGADYLWSPDGKRALVSFADAKGGAKLSLGTISIGSGEFRDLKVPTLASKCAWSKNNKTVYYALPGAIKEGAVMPNDYQEKRITTKDTFWKVDVTTGKNERVIQLGELEKINETLDAESLLLSPDEDILFFINRTDRKLYGIELD